MRLAPSITVGCCVKLAPLATKPVTRRNCWIRSRSPSASSNTERALSAHTPAAATPSSSETVSPRMPRQMIRPSMRGSCPETWATPLWMTTGRSGTCGKCGPCRVNPSSKMRARRLEAMLLPLCPDCSGIERVTGELALESEQLESRAPASQLAHHDSLLPTSLLTFHQDRSDLSRRHDHDPAFVGSDEIARPHRLSATGDRRIDRPFARFCCAPQCDAACEYGKLMSANGCEVTDGAVDDQTDNSPGLCRDGKDLSPNAVPGVMGLNDEYVSRLSAGDRDMDHEVVARMAHDRKRTTDHTAISRQHPDFRRQDRLCASLVKRRRFERRQPPGKRVSDHCDTSAFGRELMMFAISVRERAIWSRVSRAARTASRFAIASAISMWSCREAGPPISSSLTRIRRYRSVRSHNWSR